MRRSLPPSFCFNYTKAMQPWKASSPKAVASNAPTSTAPPSTDTILRRMSVIYSPECNKHCPPPGRSHPECPERLDACVRALKNHSELAQLIDWEVPPSVKDGAEDEDEQEGEYNVDAEGRDEKKTTNRAKVLKAVRAVHKFPDYLELLKSTCEKGGGGLDADTYLAPESYEIALLAASAWLRAVDIAMNKKEHSSETSSKGDEEEGEKNSERNGEEKKEDGQGDREDRDKKVLNDSHAAWALVRPPGHHATPATGMGFCLLSNAAIAAKYAISEKRAKRVAILDFDVHHGNGTEAAVKNEEGIVFVSSHEWPLYPGTGPEGISGKYDNIKNVNLDAGTGIEIYLDRYEHEILPFLLEKGKPDLVVVSAGFDALDVDPLASLDFKPDDYRVFTELLVKTVGPETPIVFGLEGGYNLGEHGLGTAVAECISGYCLPPLPLS